MQLLSMSRKQKMSMSIKEIIEILFSFFVLFSRCARHKAGGDGHKLLKMRKFFDL